MGGIIVFLLVMLLFVGGMVTAIMFALKKSNAESTGIIMDSSQIKSAQDFLPFDKIEDNMIELGGFKYRKIIECTSINYNLKTDAEKDMIEASFSRFLNSFQFPITFYIQTREMDMSNHLDSLRTSIDDVVEEFPALKAYGETFFLEMSHLPELTGNSKQKKKYIIVGYDDASALENLNAEEKREYAIQELTLRIQVLIDNLSGMGIKAYELNTAGLLELMYSTYHKDDYSNFENILTGEYTTLITGMDIVRDPNTGRIIPYINKNAVESQTDISRAENALWNAKNLITTEILSRDGLDAKSEELYKAIVDRLSEISEQMKEVYEDNNNKEEF